uniref:Uncharacterized protein n=2 Tax=Glossina TaxID=44049 RepID=A0A1A9V735_GLOAU
MKGEWLGATAGLIMSSRKIVVHDLVEFVIFATNYEKKSLKLHNNNGNNNMTGLPAKSSSTSSSSLSSTLFLLLLLFVALLASAGVIARRRYRPTKEPKTNYPFIFIPSQSQAISPASVPDEYTEWEEDQLGKN